MDSIERKATMGILMCALKMGELVTVKYRLIRLGEAKMTMLICALKQGGWITVYGSIWIRSRQAKIGTPMHTLKQGTRRLRYRMD